MFNANMDPNARIPRNALCVWQSSDTIERLTGGELTASMRRCIPHSPSVVHHKDWPALAGFDALRATGEDLRRNAMWEGGSLHCGG